MGTIFLAIALIAALVLLTSAYQTGRNRGFREGCAYGRELEREWIISDDDYARSVLMNTAAETLEAVSR
ncbi:MAG: hypothetical protein ABUJ98_14935 [Hyphomicrobium sp.]